MKVDFLFKYKQIKSSDLNEVSEITFVSAAVWRNLIGSVVLVVMATLSKEQGITVVGVCVVYELIIARQVR